MILEVSFTHENSKMKRRDVNHGDRLGSVGYSGRLLENREKFQLCWSTQVVYSGTPFLAIDDKGKKSKWSKFHLEGYFPTK